MTPTATILDDLQTLLAEDTDSLASTDALHVHLIQAPFTPGAGTDFTTLTEATFTGATALAAGTGTQQSFVDPLNSRRVVQMKEPAGGWHWQATANTLLPQTIFGFCITDNANAVTYGSALLDTPVTITDTGDGVDIDQVRFEFVSPTLA